MSPAERTLRDIAADPAVPTHHQADALQAADELAAGLWRGEPECDGRCIEGSEVLEGAPAGSMYALDPECSLHGREAVTDPEWCASCETRGCGHVGLADWSDAAAWLREYKGSVGADLAAEMETRLPEGEARPAPGHGLRFRATDAPVLGLTESGDDMSLSVAFVGAVFYSRASDSAALAAHLEAAARMVREHGPDSDLL